MSRLSVFAKRHFPGLESRKEGYSKLGALISRKARNALRSERFFASPPVYMDLRGNSFDAGAVVSIAFNRPDVIEWQVYLVRKYVAEHAGYVVFDNSSRHEARDAIRRLCDRRQVPYVGLPSNPFTSGASHAAALNWSARNFIAKHRPSLFGFLDHDIFPVEPLALSDRLKGVKAFGLRIKGNRHGWYLWPGYCFFRGVSPSALDFNSIATYDEETGGMDTGGAIWRTLYRHLSPAELRFVELGQDASVMDGQPFEMIDGWIHARNVSGHSRALATGREAALNHRLRSAAGERSPETEIGRI